MNDPVLTDPRDDSVRRRAAFGEDRHFVRTSTARALLALLTIVVCAGPSAGQTAGAAAPGELPIFSRDENRRATIRAMKLAGPMRVDGQLDEAAYRDVPPITDFIQTLPRENAEPTERTEAWVLFDAQTIYISARCWDSAPPGQWIANELRRDTSQLRQNDTFGVMLDTFYDRRNGYLFYANPLGAMADQTMTDEGNPNQDWNPVWQVRTGRFEGGWTIEMGIPFKSLRYRAGPNQTWGNQIRRAVRRKNEWEYINPLPLSIGGAQGIFRISAAATLVGLDLPEGSRNLEIKPYGISRLSTDHLSTPPISNDFHPDVGGDLKYGVTANLTADLTYNTDFAQVEVDEQQVNLTRFSLVFPEKREFFLEGRGIFEFGRGGVTGGSGGPAQSTTSLTPQLFYTRRIGLNRGRVIPIDAGGRLTGKVGGVSIGAMNIETAGEATSATPATNFTVLRVKRDVFRKSSIGALFTNRSRAVTANGSNETYGADANLSFSDDLTFGGYYARTRTGGLAADAASYQGRFEYAGDRYGVRAEYLTVGDNFNPEVGLVRRDDFNRSFGGLRFSPRPRSPGLVRKYTAEATVEYIENRRGVLETRQQSGRFNLEFENSDQFTIEGGTNFERLLRPFEVSRGVVIESGAYDFTDVTTMYAFGQQRRISGTLSLQSGQFYDGTVTALSFSAARVSVTTRWSMEPAVSLNRVELQAGAFTSQLFRLRSDYGFTPRMFASALVQYNSADRAFSTNFRFRWEYQAGSEFFAVYTDERDTQAGRISAQALKNRAFVLKINRLLRF
jgi:hypothetical protein